MLAKYSSSLVAAVLFSLVIFVAMQMLIATDGLFEEPNKDHT